MNHLFLCRIMILRRNKLGSTEDLNFTSRIKNAESNYFPGFNTGKVPNYFLHIETQKVITWYFRRFYMRQVNWEEKSVRLPIFNSFKAVKLFLSINLVLTALKLHFFLLNLLAHMETPEVITLLSPYWNPESNYFPHFWCGKLNSDPLLSPILFFLKS